MSTWSVYSAPAALHEYPRMSVAAPARRLAATHWPVAAVCALFLLVAAFASDDYGIWVDTEHLRRVGIATLDYFTGDGERALDQLPFPSILRYYGAVFETPLALLERFPGLEDSRDISFLRHLLTHVFFLAGGVFCYLLVLRMFGSRPLALIAMVLFLLHPRIYAHSFFNSKDPPFLAAFMIALYLAHRAFRRDSLGSFLLCGAGIGLLANLRILGIMLFIAVLALRALDLLFAGSADERKHALVTGGAFALAATLTYYASLPVLWTDPVGRFVELVRTAGAFPHEEFNLFRGEWLYSRDGPPWDYVPVWVGITTPPATLLLALAGALALAWKGLRRPGDLLRNGPLRFGLLLAALPVATTVAVVVLGSNIYTGWRLLYFLYAPLLLLAAVGLHQLASSPCGRWMRTGAYLLAGAAIAVALVSMVRIHPYESLYFNGLTDRTTPERLGSRYNVTGYSVVSSGRMLTDVLHAQPSGEVFVSFAPRSVRPVREGWLLRLRAYLRPDERKRVAFTRDFRSGERNLHVSDGPCHAPFPMPLDARRLYGVTISCVAAPEAYFGGYRREALATEPLERSRFDIHRVGDAMVYVRDRCSLDDMDARFFLRIHPVMPIEFHNHPGGVFTSRTEYGFEKRDFAFTWHGVRIDGDCVAVAPLPDYPIARIETGQFTPEYAEAALRAVAGNEPLARSRFDVWLAAGGPALIYARDDCSPEDMEARFFVHVRPSDAYDVHDRRVDYGFDNLNFDFPEYGVRTGDSRCVAIIPLPAYPIANIQTGQFDETGRRWTAELVLPRGE